ncbi:response regulator [Pseudodesulfovibrio sp. F-1]|uniref:histidine kinase n=2 Tax=Pseudodesulfovibrio alkaliphilus TaxID=2661613 RepID=A0A7K1KKF9_9BACT|nr:response regulator [Pseudodesulfovibrio alkaliphilus]
MALPLRPARPTSYVSMDETSRALLESSMESSLIIDVSGYVLAANLMAAKLYGMETVKELEQANIYDLLPRDSADSRRERIAEAIESVRFLRFEEEVGGRSLVHSIVPVTNPWGEVTRLAINTLDLTELRRTDEDLRREQQRQIFFMESLPGIVYHLYPDQSIRYANRYFRKYFGSPKGKKCADALNCANNSCEGCPPMESMGTDRTQEWDWTDARGRTFHLQCSPMTDSSGERMIMVLGIDITDRKRAEDALKIAHDRSEDKVRLRTRELERANAELTSKSTRLVAAMKKADAATRAKSAFLANMSHEIRTPLNAVLGMAELALRVDDPTRKNECLSRVLEAGTSLLTVINDILDFSKIEARKLALERIDFDVREVLRTALDMHRLHAADKGLVLVAEVAGEVPRAIVGDPGRLRQVLVNLVANAVKFTEAGGVTVRIGVAQGRDPAATEESLTLEFAVSDTGIGIPRKKRRAIFKSFLQADDSITRKHGGTGLGLAICKLLVELMGGVLAVESEEGRGSTFSFAVRFGVGDPEALEADRAEVEAAPPRPGLRVLLADDNALNRSLALDLLAEKGYEAVAVENGAQALEAVRSQRFDLVLMDVQMPVMDGITATRAIRDPGSGALDPQVPIVALTAHALKGDRERFLGAGMNGYIAKPIRIDDFYATVAAAVSSDSAALDDSSEGKGGHASQGDCTAGPPDRTDKGCHAFDRETALEMLGGNRALLGRMDAIFLRDTPRDLEDLAEALASRRLDEAGRLAHSIKGSAKTVGGRRAGALAEQVEFFCRQQDHASAAREYKTLESEVRSALEFLKRESALN